MKIILESGATKTAWRALYEDGTVLRVQTAGLSPTCLDVEQTRRIVAEAVPQLNPDGRLVSEVYLYGAGLVGDASAAPLLDVIGTWCPFARVQFHSDILAAARALFGDGSGVVAIMGTGSNSCLYENGMMVRNIRPGGYVLGDEGSGVALGRAFLSDFVKGMLPQQIEADFISEYGLDYAQIVRKVYKEQAASAFMASLAPFVLSKASDEYIHEMVKDCLESFVKRALARYGMPEVGVVGSFGCACRNMLTEIGERYGLRFVKFLPSPIDELVRYHGI